MLNIKKEGIILESTGLGFESDGVLNPAVIAEGNTVHIFYRAVAKGNYSTIGYAKLEGPLALVEQYDKPVIFPQHDYESQGTEDPRIVKIDDLYYLSYTAYDGVNALGALATSTDLENFTKYGLITPQIQYREFKRLADSKSPVNEKYLRYNKRDNIKTKHEKAVFVWSKNVVFFPRKINGQLCFLQRIRPDIQIVYANSLEDLTKEFWENYFLHFDENIILESKYPHEISYIGAGCPPIETPQGWLLIYHGVHDSAKGYVYSACAALLDLENPSKEIARLPYALFSPEFDYELVGEVNNVCFPTGAVVFDDTLYIYYGAADNRIACASMSITALLQELMLNTITHE
jgi:predicted GH43/DUF377 family glycosyl hydrolase